MHTHAANVLNEVNPGASQGPQALEEFEVRALEVLVESRWIWVLMAQQPIHTQRKKTPDSLPSQLHPTEKDHSVANDPHFLGHVGQCVVSTNLTRNFLLAS